MSDEKDNKKEDKKVDDAPKNDAKDNKKEDKKDAVADLKADTVGHFEDLAKQSKKNLSEGGENVKIDLIKTVDVRFTKDIGHIKKGHLQKLSQAAYDIYKKKEAVELI